MLSHESKTPHRHQYFQVVWHFLFDPDCRTDPLHCWEEQLVTAEPPCEDKKGDFCHLASEGSTKFSVFCWNVSSHACSSAESSLPHLHRAEICLQQALMPEIDLSRPVQQCLSKERKAFCVSFSVYCELQLVHVGRELSVLVFQEWWGFFSFC